MSQNARNMLKYCLFVGKWEVLAHGIFFSWSGRCKKPLQLLQMCFIGLYINCTSSWFNGVIGISKRWQIPALSCMDAMLLYIILWITGEKMVSSFQKMQFCISLETLGRTKEFKGNSGLKMSSDKSSRNLLQYHNRKSSAHCYREIYKTLVRFMVNIYIKSFISLRQQYLEDPHEGYSEKNINGQIQWCTFN